MYCYYKCPVALPHVSTKAKGTKSTSFLGTKWTKYPWLAKMFFMVPWVGLQCVIVVFSDHIK